MLGFGPSRFVVLLASVLKPVDDTRMRGKFAETLLERPYAEVHVTGQATATPVPEYSENAARIHQHAIFQGTRLSLARLAAQWHYAKLLFQLDPQVVIVHAPELLPLTVLWSWLGSNRKFLYDIRENYALNVTTQQVYSGSVRRWLAAGLRWVETWAAGQAGGLILAETSYGQELPFLHEQPAARVVVLENKYQPPTGEAPPTRPTRLPPPEQPLRLLYSGTISELNGVLDAITFAERMRWAWPGGATLTIIGFCQQPALLQQLRQAVENNLDWLTLIGGSELVPHARIVAEIGWSHIGLLPYRPHPSSERCRPTKLFEYLAHGLPIITSPNALWQELVVKHGAGLQLDFAQPFDGPTLVNQLRSFRFYPNGISREALWVEESKKLWLLLDSLV